MGSLDRLLRLVAALVVTLLYMNGTLTGTLGVILMVLSVVFVLTSLISFCPLYLPFGIDTRGKKE